MIRANSGDRAFWAMIGASVVTRVAIAYGVCCLIRVTAGAVREGGVAMLWAGRPSLLPAVLLFALTAVGTVRGSWSLTVSLWRTLRFIRAVRRHRTVRPARLSVMADRLRLGGRLVTVEFPRPFALTYGIIRPRVLVSTGLVTALTDAELAGRAPS